MAKKKVKLKQFKGIVAKLNDDKIINEYSKKTQKILYDTSPRTNRPNRKKPYYAGWDIKQYNLAKGNGAIVWNRTNWQLTHLLEHGHIIISQRRTKASYAHPKPHIHRAFVEIEPQFINAMRNVEIDVDLK